MLSRGIYRQGTFSGGWAPLLASRFAGGGFKPAPQSVGRIWEPEMAFFAGMLQEIGWLPLLVHAATPNASDASLPPTVMSMEERHRERGLDHCTLGTAIGGLWNFPSALVEVFGFHHEPERAPNCPELVGMVALADACARLKPMQIRGGETNSDAEKGNPRYGTLDTLRRLDPH